MISSAAAVPPAVTLNGLSKTYKASGKTKEKKALIDVDLDIPRGSLFGLLGPNGAGKSTLINILAGLVNKTGGHARIWGIDIDENPRQSRAAIGVVPQELNVDPYFTPFELLELQAGLFGVPPAERISNDILKALGLADKATAYSRTLSGGMRRRLMVAKAMVHRPPVLVLDEPTAGVDIELRQQLWAYVRELNRVGTTVLLTTHYLEEAEELCDRIAIINHGRVIACEETDRLLARIDSKEITLNVDQTLSELPAGLQSLGGHLKDPHRIAFRYHASESPVQAILDALSAAGLTVLDISSEEADLEDIFLQLTSSAHTQPKGE
ncbi:MAG: ABC transporter ATP-binding protein [Pseudomonadota bacterium]